MLKMLIQICANDTTLYAIQNQVEDIENNLQIALDSLRFWCKCKCMLLNSSKAKMMLVLLQQTKIYKNLMQTFLT